MLTITEKPYLNLYIGIPENGHDDFLFLDLVIDGEEFTMDSSTALGDLSNSEFPYELERILDRARKFSFALRLPAKFDTEEFVQFMVDNEFSSDQKQAVKTLLRLFKEEKL